MTFEWEVKNILRTREIHAIKANAGPAGVFLINLLQIGETYFLDNIFKFPAFFLVLAGFCKELFFGNPFDCFAYYFWLFFSGRSQEFSGRFHGALILSRC